MWVQHGTLLQIPHESLMGCPCRTHINTHLGPMWVLYFLLAGQFLIFDHILVYLHIKALIALMDRLSPSVCWKCSWTWTKGCFIEPITSWNLSKQSRPWSDAALCGVWSGPALFANVPVQILQIALITRRSDVTVTTVARLPGYKRAVWFHWSKIIPWTTITRKFWCMYTLARL